MTNDYRIEIPIHCDRLDKDYTLLIKRSDSVKYAVAQKLKSIYAQKLREFIENAEGPLPDLVVIYRGKAVILENVVSKNEKGLLRLLHDLTRSKLFPKPERRARKMTGETG